MTIFLVLCNFIICHKNLTDTVHVYVPRLTCLWLTVHERQMTRNAWKSAGAFTACMCVCSCVWNILSWPFGSNMCVNGRKWDRSHFLTHTLLQVFRPHHHHHQASSSVFLLGQTSCSGITGRQREDRAWPASQASTWKCCHSPLVHDFTVEPRLRPEICHFDTPSLISLDRICKQGPVNSLSSS